jgi:hypothetical protein
VNRTNIAIEYKYNMCAKMNKKQQEKSIVSVPIEAKRMRLHSQGRKERTMAREATLRSGHHIIILRGNINGL